MTPAASGKQISPDAPTGRRAAALTTLAGTGITILLTVVQAFVVVPLCLIHVGPDLYGRWLAIAELLAWVQLLDAGLPHLLLQKAGALAGRGDLAGAARWSSTTLLLLATLATALAGTVVLVAPAAVDFLGVPPQDRHMLVAALRVSAGGAVVLLLANLGQALAGALQRTRVVNLGLVTGAVVSLAVSVVLLLAGWGLWALVWALLSRAVVAGLGVIVFCLRLPPQSTSWWRSPSRAVMREIAGLAPYTSLASIGYVIANNSEIMLVTLVLGPIPALAYALTRRVFDGVRSLLDTIVWAVAGGFSHLVTASDRHRARHVFSEVAWTRFALAAVLLSIAVAINRQFVALLYGPSHFAGTAVTIALAVQVLLGGQSLLANYLWRSTGGVREGSMAIGAEAALRVVATLLGLAWGGLLGAPIGAALTSAAALAWAWRGLDAWLPPGEGPARSAALRAVPLAVLAIGCTLTLAPLPTSWMAVAVVAAVLGASGGLAITLVLPQGLIPARFRWVQLRGE